MKVIALIFALSISVSCFAQTLASAKPVKSHAPTKCETDLNELHQEDAVFVQLANQDHERTQNRIKELEAQVEELRAAAREYIKTDDELHQAYEKRMAKLNSDLADVLTVLSVTSGRTQALNQSTAATNDLVRQQKISNAIALSNLMKPVQPVQVQMPVNPVRTCTSTMVGNQLQTVCQ